MSWEVSEQDGKKMAKVSSRRSLGNAAVVFLLWLVMDLAPCLATTGSKELPQKEKLFTEHLIQTLLDDGADAAIELVAPRFSDINEGTPIETLQSLDPSPVFVADLYFVAGNYEKAAEMHALSLRYLKDKFEIAACKSALKRCEVESQVAEKRSVVLEQKFRELRLKICRAEFLLSLEDFEKASDLLDRCSSDVELVFGTKSLENFKCKQMNCFARANRDENDLATAHLNDALKSVTSDCNIEKIIQLSDLAVLAYQIGETTIAEESLREAQKLIRNEIGTDNLSYSQLLFFRLTVLDSTNGSAAERKATTLEFLDNPDSYGGDSNRVLMLERLAISELELGEYQSASEHFRGALELEKTIDLKRLSLILKLYFDEASALFLARDYQGSLATIARCLSDGQVKSVMTPKDHGRLLYCEGQILYELGEHFDAVETLLEAENLLADVDDDSVANAIQGLLLCSLYASCQYEEILQRVLPGSEVHKTLLDGGNFFRFTPAAFVVVLEKFERHEEMQKFATVIKVRLEKNDPDQTSAYLENLLVLAALESSMLESDEINSVLDACLPSSILTDQMLVGLQNQIVIQMIMGYQGNQKIDRLIARRNSYEKARNELGNQTSVEYITFLYWEGMAEFFLHHTSRAASLIDSALLLAEQSGKLNKDILKQMKSAKTVLARDSYTPKMPKTSAEKWEFQSRNAFETIR